jgi:hypothetical protein
MITFKKTKFFSRLLDEPDLKPKHEYISEQTDSTGKPLFQVTWLGSEIGKMEIKFKGEVVHYAETAQEWQDFVQDFYRGYQNGQEVLASGIFI